MKYLITHINPHLDEIVAIWLIKKFHPDFKNLQIDFVPSGNPGEITYEGKLPDTDPNMIFLGVGAGKFDEHWGEKSDVTTADLIWNWLESLNYLPDSELEKNALKQISVFAYKDDTGQLKNFDQELVDFSITNIISASNHSTNSANTVDLGIRMLDCLFPLFVKKQEAAKAFEQRIDFQSIWGKASAIDSELIPGDPFDALTYNSGGILMILVDNKFGYRQFRAKSDSPVDLTEVFEKVRKMEPEVDWWLHPNKRLLVSGGNVTAGKEMPVSKLTRDKLIELVKANDK